MCRKIINAYTHSLVLFGDAENRVQEQVKDKIDGLNDTIARLSQLQMQSEQQVSELKETNQRLVAELSHVNAERDALAAELATLKRLSIWMRPSFPRLMSCRNRSLNCSNQKMSWCNR